MTAPAARTSKLKQDRSRATRQRLIETAFDLWCQRGFDEVSVEEICTEAGVAKGTFYFYFSAKEHLLVEVILSGIDAFEETAEPLLRDGAPLVTIFEAFAEVILGRLERFPRSLVARASMETLHVAAEGAVSAKAAKFRALYSRIFAAAQERGEISREYFPWELAAIMNWIFLQAIIHWAYREVPASELPRILMHRARLVLRGAGS